MRRHHPVITNCIAGLGFALLSACGSGGGADGADAGFVEPENFIAFQRDFADFENWEAQSWDVAEGTPTHEPGSRTVYLNRRPPPGRTTFPVGTVIVKVTHTPAGAETIFAMTKRGSGFNQNGATNWEWFELNRNSRGEKIIAWRGIGPPAGETYAQTDATCNDCHREAAFNDFVHSGHLMLSGF